jgi:hypothetical protein
MIGRQLLAVLEGHYNHLGAWCKIAHPEQVRIFSASLESLDRYPLTEMVQSYPVDKRFRVGEPDKGSAETGEV